MRCRAPERHLRMMSQLSFLGAPSSAPGKMTATSSAAPVPVPTTCHHLAIARQGAAISLARTRPEVARDDMSPQGCQKAKNAT
ncbi:hypothetical protein C8Q73DRAFT_204673 [Cubamyces lactineus]|nr:hypothetical protein C8Q73DRAFT_204673 [Cubamyces lactineus]